MWNEITSLSLYVYTRQPIDSVYLSVHRFADHFSGPGKAVDPVSVYVWTI